MKYRYDCSVRKDMGYLPHKMILMPFLKKAKLMVDEELWTLMPNATTMIIIYNLHKMHLSLGDDGRWVKAHTTPLPPLFHPL